MTTIIFLGYEKGCGKDTVGEILEKKHGYIRVSFADAMKIELAKELGIDVELLHKQGKEKEKYRKKMIEFAEEKKLKDPYVWLNKAFEPYMTKTKTFKPGLKLVVTDHRREIEVEWYFKLWNEIQQRKSLSYKNPKFKPVLELRLFHIVRPGVKKDDDVLTHKAIGMTQGIDLVFPGFIDTIITNDSTIEVLEKKIETILEENLNKIFGQEII